MGWLHTGSTVNITATASNNETGLTASNAMINGKTVTLEGQGNGTYKGTYTVQASDAQGQNIEASNITLTDELVPKAGVYAVTVECLDEHYQGVANIGYSPTFDDHQFTVEVHILDFKKDIYGKSIRVNFVKRIREEMKFLNINELSEQIHNDITIAREILSV